jgi:hypothetical protein
MILQIYTLETFIYKDIEKIEKENNFEGNYNLSPFALCLS